MTFKSLTNAAQQPLHKLPKFEPSNWESDLLAYMNQDQLYKLEQELGANYVYVHKSPNAKMIRIIGEEIVQILTRNYGASWVYVPKNLYRHIRNNNIYHEFKSGSGIVELADKFGIKTPAIKLVLCKKYGYKKEALAQNFSNFIK